MNRELAYGIAETAQALGMSPADLATIISYETGGTFDPTKAGPRTQWGQHRGFLQWGEPQARQYGVDWNDPVRSQLGANGAIANYFRDRGWKPGMGLLDAYSIVNAGSPGRYNASDANNGGAPGTVRDKVESQMGGHRRNAERILQGLPLNMGTPVAEGGQQRSSPGYIPADTPYMDGYGGGYSYGFGDGGMSQGELDLYNRQAGIAEQRNALSQQQMEQAQAQQERQNRLSMFQQQQQQGNALDPAAFMTQQRPQQNALMQFGANSPFAVR